MRLREGDPETERHFVDYFTELLNLKLRCRLRAAEHVDELRQETFARVLNAVRKQDGLQHAERLGAFVNAVCNNVVLEFFRSSARADELPGDLDPPDKTINLDGALISAEIQRQVRDTLARLAPKDRDVLRAVLLEERDKEQICQDFGVDRDYLRVLLHRAKQRFRECYQGS